MNVSEFEKKTGLSRDTLRYYEKIGAITPPTRGTNGYRRYSQTQVNEIAFIKKGQAIGFSLAEIKQGYTQYQQLGHLCPDFKAQLQDKKQEFKTQIEKNQQALRTIELMLRS